MAGQAARGDAERRAGGRGRRAQQPRPARNDRMGVQGGPAARAPGAELSAPRAQGFRIWRLSYSGGHVGRREPRLYAYDGGALARARKVRPDALRSEERRVGKGCGSTCRSRWGRVQKKKKK